MKVQGVFLSIFLLLCLSTLGSCGLCNNNNAFIKLLPSSSVLGRPSTLSFSGCNSVWKGGKSCCTAQGIQQHWSEDKKSIAKGISLLKNAIKELHEKVTGPFKNNKSLNSLSILRYLRELKDTRYYNSFMSSIDVCWNGMIWARAKSLCYTCSADSSRFFHNDKAKIDMGTCTNMITKCESFFAKALDLIIGTQEVHSKLKNFKSDHKCYQEMGIWLKEISKISSGNHVLNALVTYNTSPSTYAKSKAKELICNNLLNVMRPSFIQYISPLIKLIERKTDEIIDGVHSINNSRMLRTFTATSSSHALTSSPSMLVSSTSNTAVAAAHLGQVGGDVFVTTDSTVQHLSFNSPFP